MIIKKDIIFNSNLFIIEILRYFRRTFCFLLKLEKLRKKIEKTVNRIVEQLFLVILNIFQSIFDSRT